MKAKYHAQITSQALGEYFSATALKQIIKANLGQDALKYQLNHPHFHFDENSFKESLAYVDEQGRLTLSALRQNELVLAWQALGRATHGLQDFYAHSNYVSLWRLGHPQAGAGEIDALDESLLASDQLVSGKLYYPLEVLSFIPLIEPWVLPNLPRDSHAWMNKDTPAQPDFEFAFQAAIYRTRHFYLQLCTELSEAQINFFGNLL